MVKSIGFRPNMSNNISGKVRKPQYSNRFIKQVIVNIQMNGHICPYPVGIGLTCHN